MVLNSLQSYNPLNDDALLTIFGTFQSENQTIQGQTISQYEAKCHIHQQTAHTFHRNPS